MRDAEVEWEPVKAIARAVIGAPSAGMAVMRPGSAVMPPGGEAVLPDSGATQPDVGSLPAGNGALLADSAPLPGFDGALRGYIGTMRGRSVGLLGCGEAMRGCGEEMRGIRLRGEVPAAVSRPVFSEPSGISSRRGGESLRRYSRWPIRFLNKSMPGGVMRSRNRRRPGFKEERT